MNRNTSILDAYAFLFVLLLSETSQEFLKSFTYKIKSVTYFLCCLVTKSCPTLL